MFYLHNGLSAMHSGSAERDGTCRVGDMIVCEHPGCATSLLKSERLQTGPRLCLSCIYVWGPWLRISFVCLCARIEALAVRAHYQDGKKRSACQGED